MNICVRFEKNEKAMPIQFKYHWMFRFLYLYCNYIIYYLTLYLLFIILFNSDFNLHSDKEDVCLYKISIAIIIKITETVWCSNESGSPYFQYFDYWYKVTCTKLAVCLRNSKIKNKTMSPSCDPVRYVSIVRNISLALIRLVRNMDWKSFLDRR